MIPSLQLKREGKHLRSEKLSAAGKTLELEASLDPENPSPSKWSVAQKIAVLEERAVAVQDKASVSEKRLVSEKATVFDKTPAPRRSRPQARPQPQRGPRPGCTQPQRSARPAPGGSRGLGLRRSPSPWALQRSSAPTISFQMSPGRDSSEVALTRSARVRLPARSVKLGPKLERCHSAIQRSESVKCANPSRTEFLVAPVDAARKCHVFEKELVGQSRDGPASSRKENL
uniref:Uncharacterized protein n=1 Tax=Rangifer tarandus platyrhynchus TaxID=3082113 RepID=A0ACB0EGS4_RANTA|nr:unnamed protein product [Rangifer tarandus platyrhynchus]